MATIYYSKEQLDEKVPQKIISLLTRTGVLKKGENIEAVLGSTILWGINDCIIATDESVVCFNNTGGVRHNRYSYSDIASVNIISKGMFPFINLGIEGAGAALLNVMAEPDGTKKMYDFLSEKVTNAKKSKYRSDDNVITNDSDQIKKYYELMQQGIITEDEFEAKKKQLLGL